MMSTAVLFISLSTLLSVALAGVILYPWLRSTQSADNTMLSLNVDLFESRLAELEADYVNKNIDDSTYATQKLTLQRQLLNVTTDNQVSHRPVSKLSRLIIMIWLPLLVAIAYIIVSDRGTIFALWQAQDRYATVAEQLITRQIDEPPPWAAQDVSGLMSTIQTNVYRHADDANRWMRLAEIFTGFQSGAAATEALSRAYRLAPNDAEIALTYVQSRFFSQGGQLDAEGRKILNRLLIENPQHEGAQMLMVMGDTQAGNYQQATYWVTQLKSQLQQKSGDHTQAITALDQMTQVIADKQAQQSSKAVLTVSVEVAPVVAPLLTSEQTLFVFVRSSQGGPPYAVKRLSVSQLLSQDNQLQLTLTDADSMLPERTISKGLTGSDDLMVVARISQNGTPTEQQGDITSLPIPLKNLENPITITLNKQVQ